MSYDPKYDFDEPMFEITGRDVLLATLIVSVVAFLAGYFL